MDSTLNLCRASLFNRPAKHATIDCAYSLMSVLLVSADRLFALSIKCVHRIEFRSRVDRTLVAVWHLWSTAGSPSDSFTIWRLRHVPLNATNTVFFKRLLRTCLGPLWKVGVRLAFDHNACFNLPSSRYPGCESDA